MSLCGPCQKLLLLYFRYASRAESLLALQFHGSKTQQHTLDKEGFFFFFSILVLCGSPRPAVLRGIHGLNLPELPTLSFLAFMFLHWRKYSVIKEEGPPAAAAHAINIWVHACTHTRAHTYTYKKKVHGLKCNHLCFVVILHLSSTSR